MLKLDMSQWGHVLIDVENIVCTVAYVAKTLSQWGHVLIDVENCNTYRAPTLELWVSMGPRLDRRGKPIAFINFDGRARESQWGHVLIDVENLRCASLHLLVQ